VALLRTPVLLSISGCFYLLGMWYKRGEAQKRFTFFFASTSLAGAFGGLLASAIGKSEQIQPIVPVSFFFFWGGGGLPPPRGGALLSWFD
jgi:hypothetical protein